MTNRGTVGGSGHELGHNTTLYRAFPHTLSSAPQLCTVSEMEAVVR